MLDFIRTFRADDDGAVTVDWVVLTAAIVGLGIVVVFAVRGGTMTMSNSVASSLSATGNTVMTYDINAGATN